MLLAVSDCVGAHTYSMHLDDATTMGHSDDYHQAASSVSAPAAAATTHSDASNVSTCEEVRCIAPRSASAIL